MRTYLGTVNEYVRKRFYRWGDKPRVLETLRYLKRHWTSQGMVYIQVTPRNHDRGVWNLLLTPLGKVVGHYHKFETNDRSEPTPELILKNSKNIKVISHVPGPWWDLPELSV
jgi:hypothetical protein